MHINQESANFSILRITFCPARLFSQLTTMALMRGIIGRHGTVQRKSVHVKSLLNALYTGILFRNYYSFRNHGAGFIAILPRGVILHFQKIVT